MRDSLRSVAPLIPEIGEHTFASGGKRVRPLLVLLSSRLCGYRGPRAIQIAMAVECMHSASLLHDDVIDGAPMRRGRPSVHAQYGARLAILVGDFLYARVCETLVEDGDQDILASFAESIRQMTEGEVIQLSRSFDPDVSESTYLDVIGRKTSSLLAVGCDAGAVLGGVTRAERRALRDYGYQLGLAFQLVDDALDYVGQDDELGKAPHKDVAEGKVTMPLLVALKRCTTAERDAVGSTLKSLGRIAATGGTPDRAEIARVDETVRRHLGVEVTFERAVERAAEARVRVEPFVDCEAKRALCELTEFVVARRS